MQRVRENPKQTPQEAWNWMWGSVPQSWPEPKLRVGHLTDRAIQMPLQVEEELLKCSCRILRIETRAKVMILVSGEVIKESYLWVKITFSFMSNFNWWLDIQLAVSQLLQNLFVVIPYQGENPRIIPVIIILENSDYLAYCLLPCSSKDT